MRYMALLSTVLLLGCGNGSIDGDADAEPDATEDPAPEVEIDPACEYPAGPYGTDVGDIMDNLTWDVVVGGGTVSLRQFHCDESTTLLWLYGETSRTRGPAVKQIARWKVDASGRTYLTIGWRLRFIPASREYTERVVQGWSTGRPWWDFYDDEVFFFRTRFGEYPKATP